MRRLILAAGAALFALNAWGSPLTYYVLAPEHLAGDLKIMSLEPNNTIGTGYSQRVLQAFETGTIPSTELTPGTIISGSGYFSVASNQNAADLLAPSTFAGTLFIIPHIAGSHKYYLLATTATAAVTVNIGGSTSNVNVNLNQVVEIVAGSDNAIVGTLTSTQPIVVVHVAQLSSTSRDAYPVPPAANTLVGIRSQNVVLAAGPTPTVATVYASGGTSASYNLSAYQKVAVTTGANGAQGAGDALQIVATAPIAAVQYDDGDGGDATGFWSSSQFGRRFGIPLDTQYAAFACTQANVTLTLYRGATAPTSVTCSGSATTPGKAYFGLTTNGANLSTGWYVLSTAAVYAIHEPTASDDESGNLGWNNPAGPAAPTLNAVASPTTNNPQVVTGTAVANSTVRLYVNGKQRSTATANGSGAFTINAELFDGNNVLYATAVVSGNESNPSASVSVTYNNTISRTQSGSIAGYVVWTPGSPATPYTITANLTIAAGGKLVLQPGATLKFANGTLLTATGELKVVGSPGNPVTITSSAASPVRGSWQGVLINGGSSSLVEYAVIEYTVTGVNVAAVTATVRNNTIRYFSANGVYVGGAGASGTLIQNNLIDNLNDTVDCIETNVSSPTIQGNTLTNCQNGINVVGAASPAVNGNNIITANNYGLNVTGSSSATPLPVVTGNQIFANDSWDFYTTSYATGAQNVKVNATGNWWGSTDPTTISAKIRDLTDVYTSTSTPTVDYSNYLNGPGGSPVLGNYLMGQLSTNTTLTTGTTYNVLGVLFVNSLKTLTIQPGAIVRFHGDAFLVVDGTLTVQGTSGNLATLTSGRATPARGDWPGVLLRTAGSLIDYARIEYAATAVNLTGVTGTVRNNTIRYFSANGVYVGGAGASGTLIQNNLIDNLNDTVDCIETNVSSPTIQGNTLTNCQNGINVVGAASPAVNGNNIITANNYGLNVTGSSSATPLPVVTGNQIFANDSWDFYTTSYATGAQNVKVNATGNWWGSTDPTTISAKIRDLTDVYTSTSTPTVDYSNYLNGPNGTPVPGNQLIGNMPAGTTTLTAGATYSMLGTVTVPVGATLVIPAGTRTQFFVPESYLAVKGTLQIQGTSGNMAVFTSGKYPKARGDWQGIKIESPSTGSTIDFAVIEYGNRNIELLNANALIRDCTIRNHAQAGIYTTGATSATEIRRNYVENYDKTGTGIWLIASSPLINANRVHRNSIGIQISGNSTPQITGNIVSDNANGINLVGDGTNSATSNPRPVLTGNDIFGNTNYQLQVYNYGTASPIVINATGNWWGTPTPLAGTHIKFTNGSPATTANFSSPAAAPLNGAAISSLSLTFDYFSPNADGVQDTTTLTATLSQSASWTTTLRNSAGAAVRTYTGTGTAISVAWDGKNGSGTVQPDGAYAFEVSAGSPTPQVVGYRSTQIDNTFPMLAISSPVSGATLLNSTTVNTIGTASDLHFVNYTLEYGAGAAPATWTTIATGTTAIANGTLGSWITNTTDGSIGLSGLQTLRLRSTDSAGNAGVLTQPVTLDNLVGSGITQSVAQILPLAGEQVTFNFTMSGPGTATVDIYPDLGGAAVRQISQAFGTGGAKSLVWDGKNGSGAYVPDEAYRWVLTLTDATHTTVYDPPDTSSSGSNSGTVDSAFNATVNDFMKINNTLSNTKARVFMEVTGCVATPYFPYNGVPFVQGTHLLMWDGRDAAGNLASGSCSIWMDVPDPLRPYSVIVKGTSPAITGTRPSPNLEVGAEPNIVVHSFDQIGRFTYRLSLDSTVTVKLLPPGITSFTDPSAITLVNSVVQPAQSGGQPANYTVEWKGHDGIDTNNIQVSAEGTYTIAIQAVSTLTGRTTLYRGALQLYQ